MRSVLTATPFLRGNFQLNSLIWWEKQGTVSKEVPAPLRFNTCDLSARWSNLTAMSFVVTIPLWALSVPFIRSPSHWGRKWMSMSRRNLLAVFAAEVYILLSPIHSCHDMNPYLPASIYGMKRTLQVFAYWVEVKCCLRSDHPICILKLSSTLYSGYWPNEPFLWQQSVLDNKESSAWIPWPLFKNSGREVPSSMCERVFPSFWILRSFPPLAQLSYFFCSCYR